MQTSERKQGEALGNSLEFRERVMEATTDAIAVLDSEGKVILANRRAADITGYDVEELMGLSFQALLPEAELARVNEHIRTTLVQRLPVSQFETEILRKDGATRTLRFNMQPLILEGGEQGMVGTAEDITGQKQAEAELHRALTEVERLKNQLQAENLYLKEEIKLSHNFGEIVGQSTKLKNVLYLVECVAITDATVLILGETGTGKELFARAVHNLSARKDRPFIKVDCGAIPAGLIESELLGHEKGAFTGAIKQQLGRFELANDGTIFLDEIGDLPLDMQTKLLRVLQEGAFERLGGTRTIKTNVRVVAATNRDLGQRIKSGAFREDLYYRLATFPVLLPPLRERPEDITLLTLHFIKKYNTRLGKKIESVPQQLIEALEAYHFPGNVRELENIIARAIILTTGTTLQLDELFNLPRQAGLQPEDPQTLEEVERAHIMRVLTACHWRIEGPHGAAKRLGLNPSTLRYRMHKLNIPKP